MAQFPTPLVIDTIRWVNSKTPEGSRRASDKVDAAMNKRESKRIVASEETVESKRQVREINKDESGESEESHESKGSLSASDPSLHLLHEAESALKKAYVPYSHFPVGAAVQLANGQVFTGCNIENASYSLTNCAERTAVFTAIMNGLSRDNPPVALAVTAQSNVPVAPCGACRQVLAEFCPPSMPVYLSNVNGDTKFTTVGDLLPYAFDSSQME
ncbi:cytidine deaminase [Alicyclobacillus sp. SO9]|nr:cytidine deaminase [Alicyclobacillus sp. SO9]